MLWRLLYCLLCWCNNVIDQFPMQFICITLLHITSHRITFVNPSSSVLIAFQSTWFYYLLFNYITLNSITWKYITLHYITSIFNAILINLLQGVSVRSLSIISHAHYITLYYIIKNYIALHYFELHYMKIHCITLHCITLSPSPNAYFNPLPLRCFCAIPFRGKLYVFGGESERSTKKVIRGKMELNKQAFW